MAFLLPLVQRILVENPDLAYPSRVRASAHDIRGIIISPTRELAEQIAVEAERICRNTGIKVQRAVGGTQKQYMLTQTRRDGCHLIVATPGRLHDLLTDYNSGVSANQLNALVLDEADRLLDQGFYDSIRDIVRCLPDTNTRPRQTMLFSATITNSVVDLVRNMMRSDFKFAQCVDPNDDLTHENAWP